MMLTETTVVPGSALPVLQFRDHLRLGSGFAEDGTEDALLESYLRAAMAAVEAWTGKALVTRDFLQEVSAWSGPDAQSLATAPVSAVTAVTLASADGTEIAVAAERYRLQQDTHVPALRAVSGSLPTIPAGGAGRIAFRAGFGTDWALVPDDLAHAVLMLAAYYYEYRHEARIGAARIPYGVSRLISAWRVVRLGRGRY